MEPTGRGWVESVGCSVIVRGMFFFYQTHPAAAPHPQTAAAVGRILATRVGGLGMLSAAWSFFFFRGWEDIHPTTFFVSQSYHSVWPGVQKSISVRCRLVFNNHLILHFFLFFFLVYQINFVEDPKSGLLSFFFFLRGVYILSAPNFLWCSIDLYLSQSHISPTPPKKWNRKITPHPTILP